MSKENVAFFGIVEKYKKGFITLPDVGDKLNVLLSIISDAQIKKIEKIKVKDMDGNIEKALESFQNQVVSILRDGK